MTTETEISTPIESADVDTSSDVEPTNVDTSIDEPTTDTTIAETGTEEVATEVAEERLYAGKYKSVEELENGYNEAQKFVNKANEFEKRYNELVQKQQSEMQRIQQQQLQDAQKKGYRTVEEQEISRLVTDAEFSTFWQSVNQLPAEYAESAQKALLDYHNTGNKQFLAEAKQYFPSDFLEEVALAKRDYQQQLQNQFAYNKRVETDKYNQQLADVIKQDFAEFVAECANNKAQGEALRLMCDNGLINSKEDMQNFVNLYAGIVDYAKEQAIKEYEAKKVIEETKQKSVIDGVSGNYNNDSKPSSKDIPKMTQKQFDDACDKYGMDWVWSN